MNERTVGMLAKFTGVSVHTIKYYEKIGLLSSTRKEHSNYRSYDIRTCTDIYECMKYKNLGFSLKDVGTLTKDADEIKMREMLEERLREVDTSIEELSRLKKRVENYLEESDEIEKKLNKWYIEEMPDFYIRFQTRNLDYEDNGQLVSDGINFMDYAPISKSVLKISKDSMNSAEMGTNPGMDRNQDRQPDDGRERENEFSWGQVVIASRMEEEHVSLKERKGYEYIKGGRAFVLYLKMTGPYASEGILPVKIREIYSEFQKEIPSDAYGVRIKITHDEEGNDWNYLKIYIPLENS